MYSLESPHRGDSNEYTQHTIINIKRKSPEYPKYNNVCRYSIFLLLETQERVRNNRGKRAINVRASEVLLYIYNQTRLKDHPLYLLYSLKNENSHTKNTSNCVREVNEFILINQLTLSHRTRKCTSFTL